MFNVFIASIYRFNNTIQPLLYVKTHIVSTKQLLNFTMKLFTLINCYELFIYPLQQNHQFQISLLIRSNLDHVVLY